MDKKKIHHVPANIGIFFFLEHIIWSFNVQRARLSPTVHVAATTVGLIPKTDSSPFHIESRRYIPIRYIGPFRTCLFIQDWKRLPVPPFLYSAFSWLIYVGHTHSRFFSIKIHRQAVTVISLFSNCPQYANCGDGNSKYVQCYKVERHQYIALFDTCSL